MRRAWSFVEHILTLMTVGVVRIVAGREKALEVYERLTGTEAQQ